MYCTDLPCCCIKYFLCKSLMVFWEIQAARRSGTLILLKGISRVSQALKGLEIHALRKPVAL